MNKDLSAYRHNKLVSQASKNLTKHMRKKIKKALSSMILHGVDDMEKYESLSNVLKRSATNNSVHLTPRLGGNAQARRRNFKKMLSANIDKSKDDGTKLGLPPRSARSFARSKSFNVDTKMSRSARALKMGTKSSDGLKFNESITDDMMT